MTVIARNGGRKCWYAILELAYDDEAAPPGNGHALREQFGERIPVIALPRARHFLLLEHRPSRHSRRRRVYRRL
jgi:hypothetical protein